MPQISVIMAVFNEEKYIEEAIKSILDQTFSDFEFIIIDDGSTDQTSEVIRSFSDKRIKSFYQKNGGLPVALNLGIKKSRGKYIARMDADDISFPDRLDIQFHYMEKNPDIDILGGQAYVIDENDDLVGAKKKPVSQESILCGIEYACPMIHPTYMVRADAYRKVNGYRESLVYSQDYDFLLRAIDKGSNLGNVNDFLLKYRERSSTSSAKGLLQMYLTRHVLKLHHERCENGIESNKTLSKIRAVKFKSTWWFNNLNKRRMKMLKIRKRNIGFLKAPVLLLIVILSCMHIELFYSLLRGYQYRKFIKGN